jgi:hypothetical protein
MLVRLIDDQISSKPLQRSRGNVRKHVLCLTTGDVKYLWCFPICNFNDINDESKIGPWRSHEYEKIFGPFAGCIVTEATALEVQENICPWTDYYDIFLDSASTGAMRSCNSTCCIRGVAPPATHISILCFLFSTAKSQI